MGTAERKEREKEKRRNDILNAAEKLFFSRGIDRATMDDIAEEAELSKGALYLYFKSKDEIYLGIVCRALEILRESFEETIGQSRTGMEQIDAIGEAYRRYAREYPDYFDTIVRYEASREESFKSVRMVAECRELSHSVQRIVVRAIENGMKDGTMRGDLHPMRTAYLLQGINTGIIRLIARRERRIEEFEDFSARELMDDFREMVVQALQQ